eukprot:1099129-Ditylum_brightwellii.AAC.1
MYARGATTLSNINKVGTKFRSMLLKLQTAHGKANFEFFNECYKRIKLETLPKSAEDVQKFLNYKTFTNDRKQNVSFIVHATGLISFGTFKHKIIQWFKENQVFMDMTIYRSSKDTVVCIGHLTGANQNVVHRLGYQDDIDNSLDKALDDLNKEGMEEYLETYGTNTEDAVYNIQIRTGNPNIMIMGQCVESEVMSIYARKSHFNKLLPNATQKYADLLREQNLYLE